MMQDLQQDRQRERDAESGAERACFHCGLPCGRTGVEQDGKAFCCSGCLAVHGLLSESGLGHFYDLKEHPGVRVSGPRGVERWLFLDDSKSANRRWCSMSSCGNRAKAHRHYMKKIKPAGKIAG